MGFFKKMKMKENYDLLILSTFLRIEKDNKDSSGYVHKKIDGLNIVLCMYENGNTVSINRDCPSIGYMKAGTGAFVWAKTA